MLKKTEDAIKNDKPRDTGNIERKTQKNEIKKIKTHYNTV
jgi:hypothetical protein